MEKDPRFRNDFGGVLARFQTALIDRDHDAQSRAAFTAKINEGRNENGFWFSAWYGGNFYSLDGVYKAPSSIAITTNPGKAETYAFDELDTAKVESIALDWLASVERVASRE